MDVPKTIVNPLLQACQAMGGKRRLARAVGVSPSAVTRWQKTGIPYGRVLDIERVSGVPRHTLRPDVCWAMAPQAQEKEKSGHEG